VEGSPRGSSSASLSSLAKVRGTALFTDDLQVRGALFGALVRSPHAHARIRGIRLDLKTDWSEAHVLTSADLPMTELTCLAGPPLLASDRVGYVGQPVALVLAGSRALAKALAERIEVQYQALPALLDARLSEDNEVAVHGETNVFERFYLARGEVPSRGGRRIEGTYRVEGLVHASAEPLAVVAEPTDKGLVLRGPFQDTALTVQALAELLGEQPFRVRQPLVGGSFGEKLVAPVRLGALATAASLALKRPVSLRLDRAECELEAGRSHGLHAELATRVDARGSLLSLEARLVFDGGAWPGTRSGDLSRAVHHVAGPYDFDHVSANAQVVATHRCPASPWPGGGVHAVTFALERHLDAVARALALDPVHLRRANLLEAGQEGLAGRLNSSPAAVLEAALQAAEAEPPPPPRDRPGARSGLSRQMAGRGVALSLLAGARPRSGGELRVALLPQGRVRLYVPNAEAGQDTDGALAELLAEALEIPRDRVELRARDSTRVPFEGPFLGGRTLAILGANLRQAARELHYALEQKLGREGSFAELMLSWPGPRRLEVTRPIQPAQLGVTLHAAVSDVVVDPDSGEVRVRRVVTATDAGRIQSPQRARAQIGGGVVHALATALDRPLDSAQAPQLRSVFVGEDAGGGGIGEIGATAAAASLAAAVEHACGAPIDHLPLHPGRVLGAIP
jgi:CO/xanthine dehydrogenase Mo-binding subunit